MVRGNFRAVLLWYNSGKEILEKCCVKRRIKNFTECLENIDDKAWLWISDIGQVELESIEISVSKNQYLKQGVMVNNYIENYFCLHLIKLVGELDTKS